MKAVARTLLNDASQAVIREAFEHANEGVLPKSTNELSKLLAEWDAITKVVRSTITTQLSMLRTRCQHPNARRGYNERDGDWLNCSDCGEVR